MSKERVEVELTANSAKLKSEFSAAQNKVKSFEKQVKSSLGGLEEIGSVISFAAVGVGLKTAIMDASNLWETIQKSKQVFLESSEEMEVWSAGLVNSFGQSKSMALAAASSFGAIFKVLGLGEKEVVGMSQNLVELASDMASFNNTSVEQAIFAIGAGLRGESEPLRKYAVLLDDATLKAEALKMGIYDGVGMLTVQERSQAAYNVIMDQSKIAQGDFARTADGAANSMRILQANLKNVSAELGGALLPIFTQAVQFTNDHHKAILGVISALIAYKGIKFAATIGMELVALGKAAAAMYVAKVAMDAETKSVMRNTTAHAANTVARGGGAAKALVAGSMVGEAMGKGAAGKFNLSFLAKFSPHAIAAAVGFGVGNLAGNYLADKLGEAFDKRFQKANEGANNVLQTMHGMVHAAKTQNEVEVARVELNKRINQLHQEALVSADKEKESANEHAIAVLKTYQKNLDKIALQNQQKSLHEQSVKKVEEELQKTKSLREEWLLITGLKNKSDKPLTKEEKKLAKEKEKLDKGESAEKNQQYEGGQSRMQQVIDREDFKKQLEEEMQILELQSKGELERADRLKVEIELKREALSLSKQYGLSAEDLYQSLIRQNDIAEKIKENTKRQEEGKSQDLARKELDGELQVLELQAKGEAKKAQELELQLQLRREALSIAESMGVSEEEAMALAKKRSDLSQQVDNREKGAKGIRVFNAEDSLKRRMARRSNSDLDKEERSRRYFSKDDLGAKVQSQAEAAARESKPKALLKGEDVLPGKIDELISTEKKILNMFEKITQV